MPPLVINQDVWADIISYFAISLSVDQQDEIKEKRQSLLSLALTTSELTNVSLDELWKSMNTLRPIVCVLNSDCTGPTEDGEDRVINYGSQQNACSINFDPPRVRAMIIGRATSYLARVRHLRLEDVGFSQYEFALWHTLSSLLWPSPLLPQLTDLFLNLGFQNESRALEMTYHIASFFSPTLRSLTLHNPNPSPTDERISTTILTIIQHREVNVTNLVYDGWISHRIISLIFATSSLQAIIIPRQLPERQSTPADLELLEGNICLSKLDINLRIFAAPNSFGVWLRKAPSLSNLTLRGSGDEIYSCLQACGTIDTIHSLTIGIHGRGNWRLMDLVNVTCSNLEAFAIEVDESDQWTLSLERLLLLRDKNLQSLVIKGVRSVESPNDDAIITIITTWPKLRHLHIEYAAGGDLSRGDIILSSYSQRAILLHDTTLPLDLSYLSDLHLSHPASHCPLKRLRVSTTGTDSCTASQLTRIAANLIVLFPSISSIETLDDIDTNFKELQNMLATLQQLVVASPKK